MKLELKSAIFIPIFPIVTLIHMQKKTLKYQCMFFLNFIPIITIYFRWSFHYFLYNRKLRRIVYFTCRASSKLDQIPADPTLSEDDEEYAISLLLHLFNVFIETCGKIPIWNCSKDLSNVHSGFFDCCISSSK